MGQVVRYVGWCQRRLADLLFGDRIYFPAKPWTNGQMEVHEPTCILLVISNLLPALVWLIHIIICLFVGGGFHLRTWWTSTKMKMQSKTWSVVRLLMVFGSPIQIFRTERIPSLFSDSFPKVIYNVSTLIFRLAIPSHHSACRSTAPIGAGSPRRRQTVMPGSIRLPPGGLEVWMALLLLLWCGPLKWELHKWTLVIYHFNLNSFWVACD